MAEYIDRNLIEWYGCNFEEPSCKNRECSGCSHAECSHTQVMQIPTADVIERSEYELIRRQLSQAFDRIAELDKLNGELHSKIDKAIEEIRDLGFVNRKTKYVDGVKVKGEYVETIYRDDVLKILERCLGE